MAVDVTGYISDLDHRLLGVTYGGMHGKWIWPMIFLTALGSGWASLLLVPFLVRPSTRTWAQALAAAILLQAFAVWLLKGLVGRVRPWIELGLPAPIGAPADPSFPSGHAAGSFCVAGFILVTVCKAARSSTRTRWLGLALVPLAGLIAASRAYLGAHFPSDVVVGAALGCGLGAAAGVVYSRRAGRP